MDLRLNVAHLPEGKVIAHPGGKASKGEGPYGPRGALEKEDTRPRAPLPHEPVVADALVPVLLVPEVGGPARVDLGDLPREEVGVLARVASGLPGKAPEHEGIPGARGDAGKVRVVNTSGLWVPACALGGGF